MSVNHREYWMTWEAKELVSELVGKRLKFTQTSINPIYQMWVRNTYAYYSTVFDSQSWMTALNFVGEQGELVKVSVPQARTLLRQLLTLTTKDKLAYKAVTDISRGDTSELLRLADGLAAKVIREHQLDVMRSQLAERSLVVGTSYIKTTYRSDKGNPRMVVPSEDGSDKSRVLYEGEIDISLPTVWDVLFDYTIEHWAEVPWADCRVKRLRWDLIEQHPELKDDILKLPSCSQDINSRSYAAMDNHDMVYVYELYHRPCAALPRGRMVVYSDPKTIYFDGVNEYDTIPIEQLKPEPIEGIGFGYPMMANLLPAQEMYDNAWSMLSTNASALGTINIANPRGSDVSVRTINGMNFVDYTPQQVPGGGVPTPMDLLKSAPELFKLPEAMLANMQQMSFVNAAVRGELPASTSGVAIATMTANAMEFLSAYSMNLTTVMERTMDNVLVAYRKFNKVPRSIEMMGANNQLQSKEFNTDELLPIKGMRLQPTNPLMQQIAGRLDIATQLIQQGMVKDVQGYIDVLNGEPLSSLVEPESSENDLIKTENDMLRDGEMVMALSSDKHPLHVLRHKSLLNDPRIRNNGALVQSILAHMEQHLQLQRSTDPLFMAMANTGMVPEMPMQPPPPTGGGPIDGGGAMVPGEENQELAPPAEAAQGPTLEEATPAGDLLGRQ